MRRVIFTILAASVVYGGNLSVYSGYLDYKDSVKKEGLLVGAYGSYLKYPFKLELDAEYLTIKYNYGLPDYKQLDITTVGHYFIGKNWDVKLGLHNIIIDQDDNPNNYDNIVFGGVLYYQPYKFNTGLDFYYSNYDDFKVYQISPKVGVNFGNYYSKIGSFYAEAQLNYIKPSKSGYTPKDHYTNVDLKLTNYNGKWSTSLFGSVGKSAYKVANGGFSVYNLKEEYKYSYGASVAYSPKKDTNLKVTYVRSEFEENGKDAKSNLYMFNFAKTF